MDGYLPKCLLCGKTEVDRELLRSVCGCHTRFEARYVHITCLEKSLRDTHFMPRKCGLCDLLHPTLSTEYFAVWFLGQVLTYTLPAIPGILVYDNIVGTFKLKGFDAFMLMVCIGTLMLHLKWSLDETFKNWWLCHIPRYVFC